MTLNKGERVGHPAFGTGVVEAKLVSGRVRVVFESEPLLPRTVPVVELLAMEETPHDQTSEPEASASGASSPSSAIDLAAADSWQTLEALRLGVVPARGVREYTVSRDAELASLDAVFEGGSGCRVIWGDYGTGKTHLLETAEQLALERNYAVARVTLDPREQALHHPIRLYRAITGSVRCLGQSTPGFEGLLDRLVDSDAHATPDGEQASRFFSPYLHALRSDDPEAIGWLRDYVRGDNVGSDEVNNELRKLGWKGRRVLRMSDFRTFGRMYVHLIGTLSCWIRDAGLRGLTVLFDEVERVDALSATDQVYAFQVLQHYAAVTMKASDLSFDPEQLYRGGQNVHREIPLRFREEQPLLTVFALTPLEEVETMFKEVTTTGNYDIRLGPLGRNLLGKLTDRVSNLYDHAYANYSPSSDVQRKIFELVADRLDDGHDSFRAAIRSIVFLLDADRLAPPQDDLSF